MKHAWLVIQPVGGDYEHKTADGGTGCGVQRKFSGFSYGAIAIAMLRAVEAIGGDPTCLEISPRYNRSGILHPLDRPPHYDPEEDHSGLEWAVYPCYADGHNMDVDPVEPRGE